MGENISKIKKKKLNNLCQVVRVEFYMHSLAHLLGCRSIGAACDDL